MLNIYIEKMFLCKYDSLSIISLRLYYEGKDDVSKAERVFLIQLTYDTFFNVRFHSIYLTIFTFSFCQKKEIV